MIGVFDSGVGGLTVVKEIIKELPGYDLVYFGDTARAPYGNKSKETIIKYALEDADFIIRKGAKIIIIACNTASALAYDALKENYPGVPIFEVIAPAAEEALDATKNNRIAVIGTRATIKSGIYEEKLYQHNAKNTNARECCKDKNIAVISQSCPLFVPLIEENWLRRSEIKTIMRAYLAPIKQKHIDTLILGCTHYPIIKNLIQAKVGRKVRLIDSASAVAQTVKRFLKNNPAIDVNLAKNGKAEFFVSDLTEQNQKVADKFLGKNIKMYESGDFI